MVVSLVIAGLHPAIVAQLIVEFVILGIFGSLQCYALYAGLRARDLRRRQQAKVSSMRALSAKATAICKNTGDYKRSGYAEAWIVHHTANNCTRG